MASRVISYKRKDGVDASHGQTFEMDMTTLVYLRCQRLHETWKRVGTSGIKSFAVANNVEGAGKFDDIVVRLEYVVEGVVKNKLIFIQCKHLQNPSQNFKKKFQSYLSDREALKNYLQSYEKIDESRKNEMMGRFSIRTCDTEQQLSKQLDKKNEHNLQHFFDCENLEIELLFYSNICIDNDCKLYQIKERNQNHSDPTYDIFNTAQSEQFELILNDNLFTDPIFKNLKGVSIDSKIQFCEKFRVFLLQSEPEKFIYEEMKLLKNKIVDVEHLRDLLVQEVSYNFKTQTQCNALTEKDNILENVHNFFDIRRKGLEDCDAFCKNYGITNIFSNKTIENFANLVESKSKIVIDTIYPNLDTLKIFQLANSSTTSVETLFLFLEDKNSEIKWKSSRKTKSYKKLKRIYIFSKYIRNLVTDSLKSNEYFVQFKECCVQQITLAEYVEQFSLEAKRYICNTKICFQGESIDIKSFCGESWKIFFDESKIIDIFEKRPIEINTPLPRLDFYITRSFKKEYLELEGNYERIKVWNIDTGCIVLFSEGDECIPGYHASHKIFKNMEEVRIFVQNFVIEGKIGYHLYFFTDGKLELIYSFGKKSCFTREYTIGEEALANEKNTKILILSDVAGMGKTTTLLSMARTYKKKNPTHWVFFFELNKFLHLIKNFQLFPSTDEAILFIGSTLLKLEVTELKLFSNACKESGNSALFFDAFDEISPDAEERFTLLLLALERTKIKNIMVSSRPNFASSLEEKLLCKPIKFKGLTTTEKELALEGFWRQMLKEDEKVINNDSLKETAKKTVKVLQLKEKFLIEIMEIPLQIRMVAMVYYELLSNISSGENFSNLSSIDLAALYEQFITLHAKRFYVDKHKIEWKNLKDDQKERFIDDKLKGAEEIAYQTIIPEELVNDKVDKTNNLAALCDDVGIVTNKSPVVFLHRTIAEYLTAKYIVRKLIPKENNDDTRIVTYVLVDKIFYIVRKFINSLLFGTKTNNFWPYYHHQNIENIIDYLDNTPVHVSASEGTLEIIRTLLSSNNAFLNKKNSRGKTALICAFQNDQNEAVKFLLSYKDCMVNICDNLDDTVLHFASRRGDIEIVRLILQRESSVLNLKNRSGFTPLHETCYNGNTEASKMLISHKYCSVNYCDNYGDTVLHFASRRGDIEIMQLILQRNNFSLNMQNRRGSTPLLEACEFGQTEAVKSLLSNKDCSIKIFNNDGETVLHVASRKGDIEVVQLILQRNTSLLNVQNMSGFTPLHEACKSGENEVAKKLLSVKDCSVNICDKYGDTVLHVASIRCNLETMQLILQRNSSPLNMKNKRGFTPLHEASYRHQSEVLKLLLLHKDCSVNICDNSGQTVLHVASMNSDVQIMQIILQRNESLLNMQNKRGFTPLHEACYRRKAEAAQLLLSHKDCLVNICDNDGNTVLHVASMSGDIQIMELILKRNSSLLNRLNNSGFTPLHEACAWNSFNAVKCLLAQIDCDVNMHCSSRSFTALDVAVEKCHRDIITLLLNHGAKENKPYRPNWKGTIFKRDSVAEESPIRSPDFNMNSDPAWDLSWS